MIETYDREELRDASLLSHAEARELVALEAVIRRGRAAWIEVTSALARIHEARLYRATHPSFEAYCRDRWNLTRPTAYRMIAAGEVLGDVARLSKL
jgi:hypothetical protein